MGWFFRRKKTNKPLAGVEPRTHATIKAQPAARTKQVVNVKFRDDLVKLRKKYQSFSNEYVKELADMLVQADVDSHLVMAITSELHKKVSRKSSWAEVNDTLVKVLINKYVAPKKADLNFTEGKTNVALIVGVNGTGKTTTIGKLAHLYHQQGAKILIVAADTFRAGAVAQLRYWADLVGVDFVAPTKPNQDPASVVFEAMQRAVAQEYDLVIVDTAGRLQNKVNLMKQLAKIRKIIVKFCPQGPQETLLVIDATTGRNGLTQAVVFHEQVQVTGIIVTKMDGSAKGGNIFSINHRLRLPVRFLGVGERVTDLAEFDLATFCATWIDDSISG